MDAAQKIRRAVSQVSNQREHCFDNPLLKQAIASIKAFQANRFAATYADLLTDDAYRQAAQFFLDELYGIRDFSQRDLQFARIAGALQRIFPQEVVALAVVLAELHAITERLDFLMGQAWLQIAVLPDPSDAARYVTAWRAVAHKDARRAQLQSVLALGRELNILTQTPGLRLMLRMMRVPASASGLGELQGFLESGFDKFSSMAKQSGLTDEFLTVIAERESNWIQQLFDADPVACATKLQATLGQAR
jgi:hypothetical protein